MIMERITKETYENIVYISCNWDKEYTEKVLYDLRQKYPTYLFISPVHAAYGIDDAYSIQSGLFMLDALADEMWYEDRKSSGNMLSREIEYCVKYDIPIREINEMLNNNANNNITLYTSGCPKCNILKKKLDDKSIEYSVFDDIDKMIEMGFNEMPVLDVNGKRMNYVEAVKWING